MRRFATFALLLMAPAAFACEIGVVDFQRAVNETEDGKSAQKKLDTMYSSRKVEIEKRQAELEKAIKDYEGRALILSEQARQETERGLMAQQQQFQQVYMQYQSEMQETYMGLLSDLDEKMRRSTESLGKEKGCKVVLDKAAVVYAGPGAVDLTADLVKKYNATPAK